MLAIGVPGVVGSRYMDTALVLEFDADGFGRYHLGLPFLSVEDGVGEGLILVEEADHSLGVFTDFHRGFAQGISRPLGLDLIDDIVILEGQVVGEYARFLPGEDAFQVGGGGKRPMEIEGAAGLDREAGIEIIEEFR